MPLYEYQCSACGETVEAIQKFSDQPLTDCPSCEGTLKRLLSAPAIQFKGQGWYVTDYAKKEGSAKAPDDSKKKEKSDSGTKETKSTADTSKKSETKSSS